MSAHPNVPPLRTAALTDSACPSSPWQRRRDRQSVTDSLRTWQSRRVQLEWNYCLLCSVCNGTSAARFPIHTPSGFPSLQQLSQLLNCIPYDILIKKNKSFSAVALFFPFPLLCLFLFLPPHILWNGQGEALFLLLLSPHVLVALSRLPAGQRGSELTLLLFSTRSVILNPSPLMGY